MTVPRGNYSQLYGKDIQIPCTISASQPYPTSFAWTFTKENTSQELVVTNGGNGGRYSVFNHIYIPTLTIRTVTYEDRGTYKCTGTNAVGDGSDNATLSVTGGE